MEAKLDKPAKKAESEARSPKRAFSRTTLNLILDITLLVSIIFIIWTTGMLRAVFPAPTAAEGWTLWGLTLNQWTNIQFYSICVFTVLTLEHLVLHWKWICSAISTKMLKGKKKLDEGTMAMYGIGLGIGLVLLGMILVSIALFTVQQPS